MKLLLALALLSSPSLAFTYDDLRQLIETEKLHRIEDVVERLPQEYHQNYTLMHESRSLQGASPEFPRAILFGKDASLIMTFSGSPKLNGYDSMEIIQYRKESHRFEFRRITFAEDEPGKAPDFSPANPAVCMGCHTNRLRPNWERYPEWPGAYGSFDDVPEKQELANLKAFLNGNAKTGRYRFLTQQTGSDASPYETERRGSIRFRPNFRLSSALFAYQAEALAHSLKTVPQGKKWALLFAMSLLKCDTIPVDWASELGRWYGAAGVAPLLPFEAPGTPSAFAYLLRGAGLTPKQFSTQLVVPTGPEDRPYFFHGGVAKDMEEPFANGVLTLADQTMARLLTLWAREIPGLEKNLIPFRWIENRFKKNPLDIPLAREMDEQMKFNDHVALRNACPDLVRAYGN